jgi:hypothetical protein
MPQLSDLIEKKKFVKKSYRPWDLSGEGTVDGKETIDSSISRIETKIPDSKPKEITPEKVSNSKIDANASNQPERLDNTSGNKRVTTREQADNNEITSCEQPDNAKVTTREQTNNALDNITDNAESLPYLIDTIKKLGGIQKNIFLYIINVCTARGILDTGNILASDLAGAGNCSTGSAKTSLIRLIEKRLIRRLQGKACRGGHMVLGITKETQAAAIQAQKLLFNPLKMNLTDNTSSNGTNNRDPYSSNSYKNNITTSLPDEWKKINFDLLMHIGFSETQVRQLYESNMTTPEIVQDAINRFAYGLENTDKVKAYADPLNVLMGVLRKGQRWNDSNYIPPIELALRQMLEDKRKEKERYDAMIKDLVDLEFPAWREKLSEEMISEIIPARDIRKIPSAVTANLRQYYIEKILLPRLEKSTT